MLIRRITFFFGTLSSAVLWVLMADSCVAFFYLGNNGDLGFFCFNHRRCPEVPKCGKLRNFISDLHSYRYSLSVRCFVCLTMSLVHLFFQTPAPSRPEPGFQAPFYAWSFRIRYQGWHNAFPCLVAICACQRPEPYFGHNVRSHPQNWYLRSFAVCFHSSRPFLSGGALLSLLSV